jgi:hypothetical protein
MVASGRCPDLPCESLMIDTEWGKVGGAGAMATQSS